MSKIKTGAQLAAACLNVATNYNTIYMWGVFGAPVTESVITSKTKQYPSWYTDAKQDVFRNLIGKGYFGFDCVCLIKGLLWGWCGDKSKTYGGASYASNSVPDISADQMIKVCTDVTTDFSHIEVGEAVWMSGHIGVYIGDGLAVECTPKWNNCVQVTAVHNISTKSGYNGRKWTKHGKLPYVTYDGKAEDTPAEEVEETTPISVKGIDVSKWQGDIDWEKVKADGVKFAMIRLGYGSKDGTECGVDGYFAKNVAAATKAGVDIGCYFYSYALSAEAAKKEAEFVIGVLNEYKGVFAYPVAFDIEDKSQVSLGKTVLTDMVIAFGDAIEKAGYYCSLYSNLNWLKNYLDDSRLARFDHWLAQWASAPSYTGAFGMWQHSSTGAVNGISGNVDLDIAYKDYPSIIQGKKLNGFSGDAADTSPDTPESEEPEYSIEELAQQVIDGKWGNGAERKQRLGDLYEAVQRRVNELLKGSSDTEDAWKPAVGDIVNFTGKKHYSNANAITGPSCTPGKAKITAIYQLGKSKHPYHLIRVSGGGSTVYGWVDENTFKKA